MEETWKREIVHAKKLPLRLGLLLWSRAFQKGMIAYLKQTELEKFKKAFLRKGETISVAKKTRPTLDLAESCQEKLFITSFGGTVLIGSTETGHPSLRPSFAGSSLFLRCQERNFTANGDKGRRKKGRYFPSSDH